MGHDGRMVRIFDVGGGCWDELSEWAGREGHDWEGSPPPDGNSLVLVARGDREELAGCLVVEAMDGAPRLGPMLVGRVFRAQGVGRTLLDAAERLLTDRGCTEVDVELPWGDDALGGMAQRRGYVPEVVRLRKVLSAASTPGTRDAP